MMVSYGTMLSNLLVGFMNAKMLHIMGIYGLQLEPNQALFAIRSMDLHGIKQ